MRDNNPNIVNGILKDKNTTVVFGRFSIFERFFQYFSRGCNCLFLFILVVLFFLVECSSTIVAQSSIRISGRVYDKTSGAPLADAIVEVENTAFGGAADADGVFIIENIPPGVYSVKASYVGYATQKYSGITVSEGVTQRLEFGLIANLIFTDSVTVISYFDDENTSVEGEKTVLNREDIEQYEALGISRLLQQVAGVQIESTGGSGSYSQIRIHGSRASQVLVQLDGQRLNNPQTGEVDLNEIPIEQIEKIEIIRQGNTAIFGGSAFGGVISFKTAGYQKKSAGILHSQIGSFETAMGGASAEIGFNKANVIASYQQDYSHQNFNYEYENETLERENAWYQHRKIFGKLNFFTNRHRVNFLYNYREGRQGLPSSFFEEMNHFNAVQDGTSQSLQLSHRWMMSRKGFIESSLAYHSLNQIFNNENDFSPFTRYKTQQENDTYEAKINWHLSPNSALQTRLGVHYYQERLNQQNLLALERSIGEKHRNTSAGFGSVNWKLPFVKSVFNSAQLRGALRYEKYFDQAGSWYPLIGGSITPTVFPVLNFSGSWAKSIRYPDFNSLFWKGDARARGNPELLPENKTAWNLSARIRSNYEYLPVLSMLYYSENIRDLIFWHRTVNGTWEPRNEARAKKQGVDVQLEQNIIVNHLRLQIAYSFIDALNKSEAPNRLDKRIVFTPEHTLNMTLWLGIRQIQTLLIYRYVSERDVTVSNTGVPLSPYDLWDFSISYRYFIGQIQLDFGAALKNITNTQYQLLRGFPMPGRQIQFTVKLKFSNG